MPLFIEKINLFSGFCVILLVESSASVEMNKKKQEEIVEQYSPEFSEKGLWRKLLRYARRAGQKTVYMVLLMFFAYRRKDTPAWARNIIIGTLGYFLAPFDAIPDLSPIIGYTDDIGVLSFGLVTIAAYVNEDVRAKARAKLNAWFGQYDPALVAEVDKKI